MTQIGDLDKLSMLMNLKFKRLAVNRCLLNRKGCRKAKNLMN
jgi:hypothetical protein